VLGSPPALGVPTTALARRRGQKLAVGLVRRGLRAPLAAGLVEKHGEGWD